MTTPPTSPDSPSISPIAVIGLACRLPGGIDSPQRFWEALMRGDDFIEEVPGDRWDVEAYYGSEPGAPGRSVSRWGGFLDTIGAFDADFFGMAEPEAIAVDPQHRLLLETSWEAVEHAGIDPAALARSQAGVFVGLTHSDYELLSAECGAAEGPYGFTATSSSFASARVSRALGLHGPAVTVDTACSSGLMAVHQACRSLQVGESELALAGGVSVMLEPRRSVAGSQQGMLSPTGRCRAFDAAADGFVAGEGCVVLLLKRLPEAIRDHNRILAVLRGSAANQDGGTGAAEGPSKPAQVAVYQAALAAAGVEAATVELVEAHGLGNPSADLTEYAGLAAVYGTDDRCFLGSVKTNFGHCQSASGPLGLMKAILALQHGTVPQHLHFTRLPDQLADIETNLVVPQENITWSNKAGQPRRAAVSSHGLSGTNVHVIVEQPPEPTVTESATGVGRQAPLLVPISATSAAQLRATAARLADWVDKYGSTMTTAGLADLGYTLARRRSHRPVRTAVVASNFGELGEALREIADSDLAYPPAIGSDGRGPVWVFSDQPPAWTPMVALLAEEPAFAAAIAKMEPIVAEESGFSLAETIAAELPPTEVERVQPTNFAIQVALAEAMKAHGVRPGAVVGHSLGETAAAVVAGGLTLEDGLRVACRRSRLLARIAGSGAMANVELPAQQVLSELSIRDVSDAVLAVVESPVSTTIGGDGETVRDLLAAWQQQGVPARQVDVAVALHSSQVEPVLDDLVQALADLKATEPEIPYYSATLWSPRDRPSFDGQYWADNLRYMARFAAAVQAAIKDGYRVFGELASHSRLAAVLEQNAGSLDIPIAALLATPPEHRPWNGLCGFVADLHSVGAAVDFAAHYPSGTLVEAPLPSWNHRELIFSREDADSTPRGPAVRAVHPLLGAHVHLVEEPERHVWQGEVGLVAHPWLDDHRVHNVAVLPGAAYCEMALAAARTSLGESAEVRDLRFEQILPLEDWTSVSSGAVVVAPGVLDFGVHTHQGRDRVDCATAVLQAPPEVRQPSIRDVAALLAAHQTRLGGADLRNAADRDGIQYGPAFSGLVAVSVGDGRHTIGATALAEVALPGPARSQQGLYEVHPALLEACIMSAVMRPDVPRAGDGGLLRPVGVRRLRRHHLIRDVRYCLSTVTATRAGACEADLELMDGTGKVLLTVEGLQFAAGRSESESAQRTLDERLLTIEWERRDHPAAAPTDAGSWLVLSMADATDSLTGRLGEALNGEAARSRTVATPIGRGQAPAVNEALNGLTGVVVVTPPALTGFHPPRRARDVVAHLLDIVRQMVALPGESPRLYVVTRDAAAVRPGDRPNLEQAGLRGLLRVVDSEYPHLKVTQIDVDGRAAEQDEALTAHLAEQLRSGSEEDETAWRDGDWYTARLRPRPLGPADRRTTVVEHGQACLRLQRSDATEPDSWEPVAHPRIVPGSGQIEVAVTVAGVDWAQASPIEAGLQQLGADFAGVVTAVGPDVAGHRVGDRVAGISPDGFWSTFITCDARRVATLPAELPLTEAAAWPTAYATAWYGLHDLARITPDDKVLIHRATGGVGRAAIAIARAAG
ncbi:type I polyketide synthase, partial [Mycobacterium sp. UM_Kg1]|uniref:type I polyketide synthase n=1 Tax=Mycobacterium sp. UM_Kg1 TaxID=1545691 RepID=UPI00061A9A63